MRRRRDADTSAEKDRWSRRFGPSVEGVDGSLAPCGELQIAAGVFGERFGGELTEEGRDRR